LVGKYSIRKPEKPAKEDRGENNLLKSPQAAAIA
jgi:hypothetical protein